MSAPASASAGARSRAVAIAGWGVALLALVPVSVLVARHHGDRFRVSLVSGSWLALARHAANGLLYPEVHDGAIYGGTRFMPLPILFQSAAARITGEYLTSGKLAAAALVAAVVALAVIALRSARAPWPLALAFGSAFLLTEPGVEAATNFRGDALPVALQLGALVLVQRSMPMPAAGLCAMAALSKLTALWAPAAIVLFLFPSRRKEALAFAGVYAGLVVAGVVGFELFTGGRMMRNLGLAGSAIHSAKDFLRTPGKLLYILRNQVELAWALFPLVAVGLFEGARRKKLGLFELSWLGAMALLLMVFADPGVDTNHLIDLVVLSCLCLWERWGEQLVEASAMGLAVTAIFAWAALAAFDANVADALRDRAPYPARPLEGLVARGERVLSEDPTIPVLMDETPLVTDGWILLRVAERTPNVVEPLLDTIRDKQLDKIVLLRPVEDEDWYTRQMFGPALRRAIAESYQPWRVEAGYHLYVPR